MRLPGTLDPTIRHAQHPQITGETSPPVTQGQLRPIGGELHTQDTARKAIHDLPLDREGLRVPQPHPTEGSRSQPATIPAPGERFHRIHRSNRPRHARKPRLLQVMNIDPTHARHRQSMSGRVEGQGGHRPEGGRGRLQQHRPGNRFITQDTGVPRKSAANPVAKGLNLSGSQLLPGRHVRIGSGEYRREQAAFLGVPFLHHRTLLAPLEHLLAGQQRKPGLLLHFTVAGKTLIAQQGQRAPSQRITQARRSDGSRHQQHGGPKGPEPKTALLCDAAAHEKKDSMKLNRLPDQRQPSCQQKSERYLHRATVHRAG